ncbi:MAG: hypothetical protein HQL52_00615 [Magnetococcales bacterium]|nr:hypothetical protein [Magnetococcales bacterium]
MVVFDSTLLLVFLNENTNIPNDPTTGLPVEKARERIDHLIETLDKNKVKIIIPTPALSEVLVRAKAAGNEYLLRLEKYSSFQITPFEKMAAIELAEMTKKAIKKGDKKGGSSETWAKVKFDRQILAIGRVAGASTIYSDDNGLKETGRMLGFKILSLADLDVPHKQLSFSKEELSHSD